MPIQVRWGHISFLPCSANRLAMSVIYTLICCSIGIHVGCWVTSFNVIRCMFRAGKWDSIWTLKATIEWLMNSHIQQRTSSLLSDRRIRQTSGPLSIFCLARYTIEPTLLSSNGGSYLMSNPLTNTASNSFMVMIWADQSIWIWRKITVNWSQLNKFKCSYLLILSIHAQCAGHSRTLHINSKKCSALT